MAGIGRISVTLLGRRARLRWLHQIIGGALLMPYLLLMTVLLRADQSLLDGVLAADLLVFAAALPLVAVTGLWLHAVIRTVELPLARALLGGGAATLSGDGRGDRLRTATWFLMHLTLGGMVSALTLAVPPGAVVLILTPFLGDMGWQQRPRWITALGAAAPLGGIALLVGLVGTAALCGALLARAAEPLLGPSARDRIAALERSTERLAERNRLARELHDSVGHTLSVVMVQASAAARVLDRDPEFARVALGHIEESARSAQAELDNVLGLLRSPDGPTGSQPGLADLPAIFDHAGATVNATVSGPTHLVPQDVGRQTYRIVQEALSNAIRHAGGDPVTVHITITDEVLELTVRNPVSAKATRASGGRGLLGISERVAAAGGRMSAGPRNGEWLLAVWLPLGSAR